MTAPIRVLYCIEALLPGGTEKQLASLIKGIDRRRFQPSLCTLKPSKSDLSVLECPTIELGFRSFFSPRALGCIHRLRRFIAEQQIDVVQTFFQDPTLVAWLASLRTRAGARIATFRDLGFWRTPAKVAQLRLAYPCFQGFIANSRAVAQVVHEQDRIALERIQIIPNGVVIPPRRDRAATRERPVVGLVANLDRPVKRVDLFLQVAQRIHREIQDVQFVIVGDGHLRPGLTADAGRMGLDGAVRFVGAVEDATDYISRFDVGMICSDSEGLSNAILEYMAAGIPTVARDVGGNAEAVVSGKTGILVPSDQPQAIAEAVLRLLRNDTERLRMGDRAREAAEGFSMTESIRRHQEYYVWLLSQVPGRRHLEQAG